MPQSAGQRHISRVHECFSTERAAVGPWAEFQTRADICIIIAAARPHISKSKKTKSPKIDPRLLARPRLDALFDRHARGELDAVGLHAGVRALIAEVGAHPVLDALVKRMEGTSEAERESLMLLVERLRNPEVVAYLWQKVKKQGALSMEAKTTTLVILKHMGEDVDIADPGRYFSPRDFRPSDIRSAENLFRLGLRDMARHLREARDPVEVERMMLDISRMPENTMDGAGVLLHLIEEAEAEATDLGADFLHAMAYATPNPQAQKAAVAALARLAARGVKPVTPVILNIGQEEFHDAYMTDPEHLWQQSVNVAWERAPGVIEALVFLLDFGVPWVGAIKDMYATQPLTPVQYHNHFVKQAGMKMGERVYRVSLARAQATIAAAALEADTTPDELDDRPLIADRSQQPLVVDLRGKRGKEVLSLLSRQAAEDFEDEAFDDDDFEDEDFFNFEDIMENVQGTHAESLDAWSGAPCWEPDWIIDYLATFCPELERLDGLTPANEEFVWIRDTWLTLQDFLFYLEDHAYEIYALSDVQGFCVSEHIQEDAWEWDEDHGRSRVEDLRQFFTYLAGRDLIPAKAPVFEALTQMLARPDGITLIERPEPLGGETAVWLRYFGDEGEAEPLTYNEWWTALVLEKKFRRNREKFRREACKKPDAESKLALLDRLESRSSADTEYLDDERPSTPDDYKRAEKWFERENVSEARAW